MLILIELAILGFAVLWRRFCFYWSTTNQGLSTNQDDNVIPLEEIRVSASNSSAPPLEAAYNSGIAPPPFSEVVDECPPPSYDEIFL